MPLSSWRRVHLGGRPGRLPRGSSGSRIRHWRSVRSLRAPMDRLANEVSGQMTIFLGEDPSTGGLLHVSATTRTCLGDDTHDRPERLITYTGRTHGQDFLNSS